MSGPEEQGTPTDGATTTTIGVVPVAPRTPQVLDLQPAYLIVVVVRDRSGAPVEDATVTVVVDGAPQPLQKTDAMGLVEPPFRVLPRMNVVVRADLPSLPKDAEPPLGSLLFAADVITLSAATIAERARPPVKAGFEPAWPELDPIRGVLFVTLRPLCRYRMLRIFPWQNPVLRDFVYHKDPDEDADAGRAGSGAKADDDEKKDRKQRLRDFIAAFAPHVEGVKSLADFRREQRREAKPSPELEELHHAQIDEKQVMAALRRVERRIDWLNYREGRGRWSKVYYQGDPGLIPTSSEPVEQASVEGAPEDDEAEEPELTGDDLVDPTADVGAGQRKADFEAKGTPAYAEARWRDIDTSTPRKEWNALSVRRRAILNRAAKMHVNPRKLAQAELRELSHRELLTYIVREIFAKDLEKDPAKKLFPGWVRYAVLHFSGLRYAGAHGSYYPPDEIVGAMRDIEMEGERATPLSPHLLAIFIEEHLAPLLHDPVFRGRFLDKKQEAAFQGKKSPADMGLAGALLSAAAALRGDGGSTSDTSSARSVLNVAVIAFQERWLDDLNDLDARQRSLSPSERGKVTPAPPLADAFGLLVRARDTGKLPPEAWPAVVQYTELRNDFVNVRAVAFRRPPKDDKGKPLPLDPDPAPFNGSRWPVLAPPLNGSPWYRYPEHAALLGDEKLSHAWKTQQAGDLSLAPSRAVCNQITEMLGAARGMKLAGGITADSQTVNSVVDLTKKKRAKKTDTAVIPGLDTAIDALRTLRLVNTLFIATAPGEVQRGDVMFFLTWRPLGTSDPSAWVSPFLDIPYYRFSAYHSAAPVPLSDEEKAAEKAAKEAADAAWKKAHPKEKLPKPPKPPPAPVGPTLQAFRVSKGPPPAFTIGGQPIPVIANPSDPRILRGGIPRPHPQKLAFGNNLSPGAPSDPPASQIALLLTTERDSMLRYVFVRRHPRSKVYHEVLGWSHMATVIEGPAVRGRIVTFETNGPTGVNLRSFSAADWTVLYGRMARTDEDLPFLQHYVDPNKLLDLGALPETEDR